jgi:hypothetical protein
MAICFKRGCTMDDDTSKPPHATCTHMDEDSCTHPHNMIAAHSPNGMQRVGSSNKCYLKDASQAGTGFTTFQGLISGSKGVGG